MDAARFLTVTDEAAVHHLRGRATQEPRLPDGASAPDETSVLELTWDRTLLDCLTGRSTPNQDANNFVGSMA
jgi:hypothetical protein